MPRIIDGRTWWTVQNRTDLMNKKNPLAIAAYTFSPNAFSNFKLTDDYAGEIIPAFAIMRQAGPMVIIDGEPVFPVCLPDDQSQQNQEAGIHWINGPVPIPFQPTFRRSR
jgi:hypothetical protein